MNKKLTDDQMQAIVDMRDRGMSWAAIAKAVRVTPEAARQAYRRMTTRSQPPTQNSILAPLAPDGEAVSPEVEAALIAEAEAAADDDSTEEGALRGLIKELGRMQTSAKDDAKKLSYMRLRGTLIGQLAKLRPPPPPDPNANPLVRLSAERCIAKLHELLDRL